MNLGEQLRPLLSAPSSYHKRRQLGMARYGSCHALVPGEENKCISQSEVMNVSVTVCADYSVIELL